MGQEEEVFDFQKPATHPATPNSFIVFEWFPWEPQNLGGGAVRDIRNVLKNIIVVDDIILCGIIYRKGFWLSITLGPPTRKQSTV